MRLTNLFIVAALAGAGCGRETWIVSGPSVPDTTPPARVLAAVAGDSQRGIVGTVLPTPLEVAVRDTAGRGVPGVLLQFAVVGTNASLAPASGMVLSGSDGHAKVRVTLGRRAEALRVVVASPAAAGIATFDLLAKPSPALTVVAISGDSQVVALPGSSLEAFAVAVRDTFGNRVAAPPVVTFRVISGAASFGGQNSIVIVPDSTGAASATLTSPAPADGDTVRVTASVAGMATPPLPLLAVGLASQGKTWGARYLRVCALGSGGTAYCWGNGSSGALGTGDSTNRGAPTLVTTASGMVAIAAGGGASCGMTASGTAVCWGTSGSGGAGGGSDSYRSLGVGYNAACGVSGSGTAHCWGGSFVPYGTLQTTVPSPVRFTQVSVGGLVACALAADGRAFCWGSNTYGLLGTGDVASSSASAVPVAGGLTFRALSAGSMHVCGITTAGAAYCWGYNVRGQLGNGTLADAATPVAVAGGLTFADISAGSYHTCALTPEGAAYCWGFNAEGQLGTGTLLDSRVPAPVTGGITFASIGVGDNFTCGVTPSGAMYCWGSNGSGQLGAGMIGGPAVSVPSAVTGGVLFQP